MFKIIRVMPSLKAGRCFLMPSNVYAKPPGALVAGAPTTRFTDNIGVDFKITSILLNS